MPFTVDGGSRDADGWVVGGVRLGCPLCGFCGRVVRGVGREGWSVRIAWGWVSPFGDRGGGGFQGHLGQIS